ncbi:unnamed protein product [Closterium sp. NIES-54]
MGDRCSFSFPPPLLHLRLSTPSPPLLLLLVASTALLLLAPCPAAATRINDAQGSLRLLLLPALSPALPHSLSLPLNSPLPPSFSHSPTLPLSQSFPLSPPLSHWTLSTASSLSADLIPLPPTPHPYPSLPLVLPLPPTSHAALVPPLPSLLPVIPMPKPKSSPCYDSSFPSPSTSLEAPQNWFLCPSAIHI